jgi:hypothetical protein
MAWKIIPQLEFEGKNVSTNGRQHHWAKCIAVQGEYFEGDPLSVNYKYTGTVAIKSFRELHSHNS